MDEHKRAAIYVKELFEDPHFKKYFLDDVLGKLEREYEPQLKSGSSTNEQVRFAQGVMHAVDSLKAFHKQKQYLLKEWTRREQDDNREYARAKH